MLIHKNISPHTPIVSVVCLTYNQAAYIAQAIEGFVSQETDFPFEIIIHDDASTDGTLEVVKSYQAKYPDLITVISQTRNVYSTGVRMPALVFSHARGSLIAYCEGDDFWCNPHKLQMQADFLQQHPDYGAVFTDRNILYQHNGKLISKKGGWTQRPHSGDVRAALLMGNTYAACTAMFRTEAIKGYETVAAKLRARMDDYVMWLHIASKYKIKKLEVVTATYRVLKHSASHSPNLKVSLGFFASTYLVANHYNKHFGTLVDKEALKERYRRAATEYCLDRGHYRDSVRFTQSASQYSRCLARVSLRKLLNLFS